MVGDDLADLFVVNFGTDENTNQFFLGNNAAENGWFTEVTDSELSQTTGCDDYLCASLALDADADGRIAFSEFSKVFASDAFSLPHGLVEVVEVGSKLANAGKNALVVTLVDKPVAAVTTFAAIVEGRDLSKGEELWGASESGDEAAVRRLLEGDPTTFVDRGKGLRLKGSE